MTCFHLILSYDGTHFFGWQKTAMGPSIQEDLSLAIEKITGETVLPEAASRTDRGVHAQGQSVVLCIKKEFEPSKLLKALNAHLPQEIRVKKVKRVNENFHPTLEAKRKEYRYYCSLSPFQYPMERLYSWHIPHTLNLTNMKKGAKNLIGRHNFQGFSTSTAKDPICEISKISFQKKDHRLEIHIHGDRFLYKMVRSIVGTLCYVGLGKLDKSSLRDLLETQKREDGGVTAPAHGLFLYSVIY